MRTLQLILLAAAYISRDSNYMIYNSKNLGIIMPSVERQSDCCHMSKVFVLKVFKGFVCPSYLKHWLSYWVVSFVFIHFLYTWPLFWILRYMYVRAYFSVMSVSLWYKSTVYKSASTIYTAGLAELNFISLSSYGIIISNIMMGIERLFREGWVAGESMGVGIGDWKLPDCSFKLTSRKVE